MQKQLKAYFKSIKKNLPCMNSAIRKMLEDLKLSINTYIAENDVNDFETVIENFGTAEDIAKEFAIGIDNEYISSYKFKKRAVTIIISILAAIAVVVASLALYIYINTINNTPYSVEYTISYQESE